MKFTLIGKLPSKKNTTRWGKHGFYNTKTIEMNNFVIQLMSQKIQYKHLPLKNDCRLNLSVWGDNRNDLNNQLTTLCDILEEAGVVENDRQIKNITAKKYHDIKNPRCEITIS